MLVVAIANEAVQQSLVGDEVVTYIGGYPYETGVITAVDAWVHLDLFTVKPRESISDFSRGSSGF